ncbi:hypothetical protein J3R30DRAFT_3459249 [Lentinula aciculospora]|uniref:Uncharacterized protein n=1 Tax=Lentinula aciculospora TaxID=153920 RepID=A0A9W9DRJ8_9AGAR|nr:hypothetical protein J3R30DRAFT_3459249 [Lentinula aciculospora]
MYISSSKTISLELVVYLFLLGTVLHIVYAAPISLDTVVSRTAASDHNNFEIERNAVPIPPTTTNIDINNNLHTRGDRWNAFKSTYISKHDKITIFLLDPNPKPNPQTCRRPTPAEQCTLLTNIEKLITDGYRALEVKDPQPTVNFDHSQSPGSKYVPCYESVGDSTVTTTISDALSGPALFMLTLNPKVTKHQWNCGPSNYCFGGHVNWGVDLGKPGFGKGNLWKVKGEKMVDVFESK